MKRKGPVVDLKSFLEKAAAKKRAQEQTQTNLNPSICQESQMQLVIYQGQPEGISSSGPSTIPPEPEPEISDIAVSDNESKSSDEDIDKSIYNIEHDPLRSPILSYGVNDQDIVRRAYIALGPCRPKMKACDIPQHNCGGMRRFQPKWFDEFKWLEYSVHKDAAYCFVCYLFKDGEHGKDAFVSEGFTNWNMKDRIRKHAGAIEKVLSQVGNESNGNEAIGAMTMLKVFTSFEFVFLLHLMHEIFGYSNDLCAALQRRDQDIVNAMDLLVFTKLEPDVLRKDAGWREFLNNVISFCEKHQVKVVDMDGKYKPVQRSKQFYRNAINYHRYHHDMFLGVIDRQVKELNNRFDEVNTELLRCMASFSPSKSFSAFSVETLVKLAGFYPHDFEPEEMNQLPFQLRRYIDDVRNDDNFKNVKGLSQLSVMLVKTGKVLRYDIVYKLLKLVLLLPVATAGVERIFHQ